MMFYKSCIYYVNTNDDLFIYENNMLFLDVKISCFHMMDNRVFLKNYGIVQTEVR